MYLGASPRSEIYLFNDPEVASRHAFLSSKGEVCEIESMDSSKPVCVNGAPVKNCRLQHGDQIRIGRTVFVFEKRESG
jgi:pSer/pThr/pTyr-binding forkhead associated (FHA) protein